jgi:hypothetical protein
VRSKQSGEFVGHARVAAAIAVAVVIVVITGCKGCTSQRLGAARNCDPSIDDQARWAAMVSAYVQAYSDAGLLHGATTPSLRIPLVQDAVRTLKKDCDEPIASMRRRRAVAKLAAYGREKDPSKTAWHDLVDNDPNLIDKIHTLLLAHPSPPVLESQIFNETASMTDACRAKVSDPDFQGPPIDPGSGEVSWEVSFTIQETVDWVSKRIDPQNWHVCGQFPETKYTTDTLPHVSSCDSPPSADPAENDPKTPGSAPYHATLFEHFKCQACDTDAETLLDITTAQGESCGLNPCDAAKNMGTIPAHQICYSLPCSYDAQRTACGDPPVGQSTCCNNALYFCAGTPGHHMDMTIDQGDLTACKISSGSGLRTIARKNVKFDSAWQTYETYILYYVGQQATIDGCVTIACCDLT